MKVLKANPFSLLSGILDRLNSDLVLTSSHGKLVIACSANCLLSELLKLGTWIRSWRNDEEDWLSAD